MKYFLRLAMLTVGIAGLNPVAAQVTRLTIPTVVPAWNLLNRTADKTQTGYVRGLDRAVRHGGKASGTVRSVGSGRFGTLTQGIRADHYRGKRVRLSGWIKAKNASAAGLWLRVDGEDQMFGFDNMLQDRPIAGTQDWARVTVVLDVPTAALGLHFGALLVGEGQVWVDDLALEIVDPKTVETTMPTLAQATGSGGSLKRFYQGASTAPLNLNFEK